MNTIQKVFFLSLELLKGSEIGQALDSSSLEDEVGNAAEKGGGVILGLGNDVGKGVELVGTRMVGLLNGFSAERADDCSHYVLNKRIITWIY